jgi:DNA polymerase-4
LTQVAALSFGRGVPLATIAHLDADAFFVSVELALKPELRGKKVAVGGRQRGIISSASYEARAVGVYTPMPSQRALAICPDLILLPHEGDYSGVSRRMFDLCEDVTPFVQRNSIDEGYLDLGPCGLRDAVAVAAKVRELQQQIWAELNIPVSMGIATNRLVAQIASKLRKPKGFVIVPPGEEGVFMAQLDIGELPGVGKITVPKLQARGIFKVSDVLERSDTELASLFGSGWRLMLDRCRGIDPRPVEPDRDEAKSYSQQRTFGQNIADPAEIETIVKGMVDHLVVKVRRDETRVRTITVKVRYADFSQESAGRSLASATDIGAPFYPLLRPLLRKAWKHSRALRLVSVKLSGVDEGPAQLDIFGEKNEKRRKLAGVMDRLNQAGDSASLMLGHQLEKKKNSRGG